MKPTNVDAARLIHRPSTAAQAAAGCMAGSMSNPLVGSRRQAAAASQKTTTVAQKAAASPKSLSAAVDPQFHRFRLLVMIIFIHRKW